MKRQFKSSKSVALFEYLTAIFILLLCTVFLLYPGLHGYEGLADAKYILFLVLCGGYSALMLLLCVEQALIGELKIPPLKALWTDTSWLQRFILLYLCLTWVSAILSPYWPDTVIGTTRYEGALTITVYCFCFFFVSRFGSMQKWMLWILCGTVLLFDLFCIIQLAGANPLGLYPEGMTYYDAYIKYSGAFLGTIGNVGFVASFLGVVVPMLWIGVVRLPGRRERTILIATLAVTLFVLWKMWVLAAVAGVLAGTLFSLPVVLPLSHQRKKQLWVVVAILCAAGILVLYFLDVGNGFLHELHELLHGRVQNEFGSGRIYIWKSVLERVPDRLLFGYGPDTMIHANIAPFSKTDAATGAHIQAYIDTAHNEYLNILYHQGILALGAYLIALLFAAADWLKNSAGDPIAAMAGGGVLCYCIQAMFGISTCISAPYFWLALALLEQRTHNRKEGGKIPCGKN